MLLRDSYEVFWVSFAGLAALGCSCKANRGEAERFSDLVRRGCLRHPLSFLALGCNQSIKWNGRAGRRLPLGHLHVPVRLYVQPLRSTVTPPGR